MIYEAVRHLGDVIYLNKVTALTAAPRVQLLGMKYSQSRVPCPLGHAVRAVLLETVDQTLVILDLSDPRAVAALRELVLEKYDRAPLAAGARRFEEKPGAFRKRIKTLVEEALTEAFQHTIAQQAA